MKLSSLLLIPTLALGLSILEAPASQAQSNNPNDVIAESYDHNGSQMRVDSRAGTISYVRPKRSISDVVFPGAILFQGRITPNGRDGGYKFKGVAYTFAAGCEPAPYPVVGDMFVTNSEIVLHGAAPIRKGCRVVGYSASSPHSVLKFSQIIDD